MGFFLFAYRLTRALLLCREEKMRNTILGVDLNGYTLQEDKGVIPKTNGIETSVELKGKD